MALSHGLGVYGNAVGVVTPTDHKQDNVAFFARTWAGTNTPIGGIIYDGISNIVTGTSATGTMTYGIAPFTAVISRGSAYGAVPINNSSAATITTTAAPASGYTRYDLVLVWHPEYSFDGGTSDPQFVCLQGNPATSGWTAPSTSAYPGAIVLAQITVPSGVTRTDTGTTVSQQWTATGPANTPVVVPDTATRTRSFPAPVQGSKVFNLGTDCVEEYYAAYNASTNPLGASSAGWYPTQGALPMHHVVHSGSSPAEPAKYVIFLDNQHFPVTYSRGGISRDSTAGSGKYTFSQLGDYKLTYHMAGQISGGNGSIKVGMAVNNTAVNGASEVSNLSGLVFEHEIYTGSTTRAWLDGTYIFSVRSATDTYRLAVCSEAYKGTWWAFNPGTMAEYVHFEYLGPTRVVIG